MRLGRHSQGKEYRIERDDERAIRDKEIADSKADKDQDGNRADFIQVRQVEIVFDNVHQKDVETAFDRATAHP